MSLLPETSSQMFLRATRRRSEKTRNERNDLRTRTLLLFLLIDWQGLTSAHHPSGSDRMSFCSSCRRNRKSLRSLSTTTSAAFSPYSCSLINWLHWKKAHYKGLGMGTGGGRGRAAAALLDLSISHTNNSPATRRDEREKPREKGYLSASPSSLQQEDISRGLGKMCLRLMECQQIDKFKDST